MKLDFEHIYFEKQKTRQRETLGGVKVAIAVAVFYTEVKSAKTSQGTLLLTFYYLLVIAHNVPTTLQQPSMLMLSYIQYFVKYFLKVIIFVY